MWRIKNNISIFAKEGEKYGRVRTLQVASVIA